MHCYCSSPTLVASPSSIHTSGRWLTWVMLWRYFGYWCSPCAPVMPLPLLLPSTPTTVLTQQMLEWYMPLCMTLPCRLCYPNRLVRYGLAVCIVFSAELYTVWKASKCPLCCKASFVAIAYSSSMFQTWASSPMESKIPVVETVKWQNSSWFKWSCNILTFRNCLCACWMLFGLYKQKLLICMLMWGL